MDCCMPSSLYTPLVTHRHTHHTITPSHTSHPRTGPVMVTIVTVDTPDPFGRIRLRYNTSRSDVFCGCRVVGGRPVDCSAMEYLADPRELGAGDHTLSISCMDGGGYVDTKTIKLSLSLPPTPRK